ncbi:hypothetical protein OUZ56_002061 [Daphnia magna]|uniref:Uncharacterized protein n=1 Tax=Daphnia magna TaxID=35525 RepID=A0ABR0A509_9CRUS|nr:hypothetical protein OUZ56_002061 [Daphnia magna]
MVDSYSSKFEATASVILQEPDEIAGCDGSCQMQVAESRIDKKKRKKAHIRLTPGAMAAIDLNRKITWDRER